MEKVFSVEDISGNDLWPALSKESNGTTAMNRSESEWAFHRFIQETSATTGEAATACGVSPPNVPVDSEEYREFLKSKLNLACAAVAMKRVKTRVSVQRCFECFFLFGFLVSKFGFLSSHY